MLENIVHTDKLLPLGLREIMQLKELYTLGKENLGRYSIETPGLEAYLLLSELELVDTRSEIYAKPEKEVDQDSIDKFQELIDRRAKGEPIAYITGEKEFYSNSFKVNSSVLIPRPETELLVDETLAIVDQMVSPRIIEIGTGSGCISVSLASMCKDIKVVASDISESALEVAKENTIKHGLDNRIALLRGNLLSIVKNDSFDIVVSNPPYIPESEIGHLEPEVKDYEPVLALSGGENGLEYIKEIISNSVRILKNSGWCVLEIGQGQAKDVVELFKESGFTDISTTKDLNKIERVIKAKWKK